MTFLDDQHYIKLVINGNTIAFEKLIEKYKDLVFTLALKLANSREDAEEIAQDSFIKAYKNLHQYKSEAKFSTWIYTITYNTSIDKIRKQKNEKYLDSLDDVSEYDLNSITNVFNDLENKERKNLIKKCLNELPKEDCFLLTLYHFEDQSLKEISNILNISTNHIKIKLFRARKKLAVILKQHFEPELISHYELGRK